MEERAAESTDSESDTMPNPGEVTELLAAHRRGDSQAMGRLLPLVYDELRLRAHRQLARRRPGQTLNTTALAHEAYLKLAGPNSADWQNQSHFMAVASIAMRQILVDYARRRGSLKRGEWARKVELDEALLGTVAAQAEELLALDESLLALAKLNSRLSRVVEMRFFGGLSIEQVAEVLGVTGRTVKRDWRTARAYLYQRLSGQEAR